MSIHQRLTKLEKSIRILNKGNHRQVLYVDGSRNCRNWSEATKSLELIMDYLLYTGEGGNMSEELLKGLTSRSKVKSDELEQHVDSIIQSWT